MEIGLNDRKKTKPISKKQDHETKEKQVNRIKTRQNEKIMKLQDNK